MRTSILVLTIVGASLSLIVAIGSGTCIQGVGELNRGVGNMREANEAQSLGGELVLIGLLQCAGGVFGGLKGYRRFGTKESIKWGLVPLVVAACLSIFNTCQFFTGGVLFLVAALLIFLGYRAARDMVNAVPSSSFADMPQSETILPPRPAENAQPDQSNTDGIGNRLKSAGLLAAKQAQRTKIVTLTLPAIHKSLGRHLYGAKRYRDEFVNFYREFDQLSAEMNAIKGHAGGRLAGAGLAAKAKSAAAATKDMAQMKTLEMRVSHVFGRFGAAVYDKHGIESGPPEVVQPVSEARLQLATLDAEIEDLLKSNAGHFLTPKRIAIGGVCLLVLVFLVAVGQIASNAPKARVGSGGASESTNLISVSAVELIADFKANEVNANSQYKGHTLRVQGIVDDVKDMFGSPHVYLSNGASYEFTRVDCAFDDSASDDLRKLYKGQVIAVQGECTGLFGDVGLENCTLVKTMR